MNIYIYTYNIHMHTTYIHKPAEHMLMEFFIRASGTFYCVAEPMRPLTLSGNAEVSSTLSSNAVVSSLNFLMDTHATLLASMRCEAEGSSAID
jgi:hypothetical protein